MSRLRDFIAWLLHRWHRLRQRLGVRWPVVALLVSVAVLALVMAGYTWWWRFVADRVRTAIVEVQTDQRTLGRNLEWQSLAVTGFPYLVEATLTKARLLAPDTGAAWDGERVVAQIQPLALNSVVFSLEGEQHLFYVGEGRWIEGDARADKALVTASSQGDAQRIGLDIERLTGKGKLDETDFNFIVEEAISGLTLSAVSEKEPLPRLELVATIDNVALQGNVDFALGPVIEKIKFDLGMRLPGKLPAANIDAVVAAWRLTDTPFEIRHFELEWGGISVEASGEIKLDGRNLPEGRLRLTLGNHPRILELLEANGWISRETHAAAKPVLDVLAFVSGDPKRRVTVPLRFEKGDVFLGIARVLKMQPLPSGQEIVPIP